MPNIEDQIQKAIDAGQFDDLPGKGKPLHLDENPFVDPEWRLAHHVLKTSGYTLPWIEARRAFLDEIESARASLVHAWAWRQESQGQVLMEKEWQQALAAFEQQAQGLNKKILTYNLEAPNIQFQLPLINFACEVAALTGNGE